MLKELLKMKTTTLFNLLAVCLISAGCGGGGKGGTGPKPEFRATAPGM